MSMGIGSVKHWGKQVEKLLEGNDKLFNEIDYMDLLNSIAIDYTNPGEGPPIRKTYEVYSSLTSWTTDLYDENKQSRMKPPRRMKKEDLRPWIADTC